MKQLLFLVFIFDLFASSKCIAQEEITQDKIDALHASLPKKVDGQYEFTDVIKLDSNYTKDDLYRNEKFFFADYFKNGKEVLQYDDRNEGKVVGKGDFKITTTYIFDITNSPITTEFYVNFTIEIISKEGKYKYRLYDVTIEEKTLPDDKIDIDFMYDLTKTSGVEKAYKPAFFKMVYGINSIISDLKGYMAKKKTNDDF